MIRRSLKRPESRGDGLDVRHDFRAFSEHNAHPPELPLPDSSSLRFTGYREKNKASGTENNYQRYLSGNKMENQTQADRDNLADALGPSHQQELHRTRRGWTNQRAANRGGISTDKLQEGLVDDKRVHDDRREFRTTKRQMLRLVLALVGEFLTASRKTFFLSKGLRKIYALLFATPRRRYAYDVCTDDLTTSCDPLGLFGRLF